MSQEELGARAALHRNYLGGVERGERNISIDNMDKIASALGVSVRILLEPIPKTKSPHSSDHGA